MSFFQRFADVGRKTQAKMLSEQGYALIDASRYREAIQPFTQAWEIYRAIGDHHAEVDMLRMLGNIQQVLGNYQQAIDYGEQAVALARSNNDLEGESMAQGLLGNCYMALSDYALALEHFERRLSVARQQADHRGEATMLMNISGVYQGQGDSKTALRYLTQALTLIRTLPDREGEAIALDNLGRLYFQLGDFAQAKRHLEQSLVIAQKSGERRDVGNVLEDLGNVCFTLGDYKQALAYQQQSLDIMRDIGDKRGEAMVLNDLGNLSRAKGDYLQTIHYRQQQLALARSMGALATEALALGNLGNVFQALGDFVQASSYQQQQLSIAQRIQDRHQEATCLGNLANTYLLMKHYDQSRDYNERYLKLAREMEDRPEEMVALTNLANLASAQYDSEKALEHFQQSLSLARMIKDQAMEGIIADNIGTIFFAQGNYAQSITSHQQALTIARQIGRPPLEGIALHNLGLTLFQLGELWEAEKTLRAAMQIWETIRTGLGEQDAYQISLFEQQAKTYSLLQQVLVAQNQIEQALEIAERGRAQAFAELLARSVSPQALQAANPQLARIDIAQMKRIAQEQQATIVEYSLSATDSKDTVQRRYPGGEVFIWVINPTGDVQFRRADLKPLLQRLRTSPMDTVARLREEMGARGRDADMLTDGSEADQPALQQELQFFSQLLIEPIANLLPKDPTEHVILVPQHFLFLLPFAALQDRSGQALIEQHTLRLVPSLQVLTLTQQRHRLAAALVSTDALIVGNPTMPEIVKPDQTKQQLPQLPGTAREARAIADLLHVVPMIGDQATKEAVVKRMATASLIHLATHGLLDDEHNTAIPGAIALAPSGEDDGWLTSEDILTLKLGADLAVLSACDTAQGRVTGDGIIGLSRSFIAAGVPSIIASLWSIPDAPTAFFVTEFYHALQQHPDKAQALRHAMRATKQRYPDPLTWAAFVLIGEAL